MIGFALVEVHNMVIADNNFLHNFLVEEDYNHNNLVEVVDSFHTHRTIEEDTYFVAHKPDVVVAFVLVVEISLT